MHVAKTVRLTPSEPTPPAADSVVQHVLTVLEDGKAEAPVVINLADKSTMADYMVIVTGTSTTHLRSMADEVVKQARTQGQPVIGEEGRLQAEWILVDLGAVIVHIMLARARALYSLEDLWNFDSSAAQLAATRTARDED